MAQTSRKRRAGETQELGRATDVRQEAAKLLAASTNVNGGKCSMPDAGEELAMKAS
ncbi:hypothetical protein ACTZWT_04215 [Rhodopseudomonas sp. NSM]